MSINAQIVSSDDAEGSSRAPRRHVRLQLSGATRGEATDVVIHNISDSGALLETPSNLAIDEEVTIELPQAGSTVAHVVWSSGNFFGCRFAKPVSSATLSAAQLRSPTDITALPAAVAEASETFSIRLRRIREERGLTLAALAGRLQMSTPGVWRWEAGRGRPTSANLCRLAEVLGVPVAELLQDEPGERSAPSPTPSPHSIDDQPLSGSRIGSQGTHFGKPTPEGERWLQIIEASKAQIAALAGTTPDHVKIIIEL